LASFETALTPECTGIAIELAVNPVEVAVPREIPWADRIVLSERMVRRDDDHELFPEQGHVVQPFVWVLAREAVDGDLEVTVQQAILESGCARVENLKLDTWVPRLQATDEIEEFIRLDRAHDSKPQRRFLELGEIDCLALCLLGLGVHLLEMRLDHASEL
jgi:hypothetical protein